MNRLFLLALPVLIFAGASAVQAREPSKPVACIYESVAHNRLINKDKLHALVDNGMVAKNNDDKMMLQLIGQQVSYCKGKYGWGQPHQQAAVKYLQARMLYDTQDEALKQYGVTYTMLDAIADGLTPDARQAYLGGTVTGNMVGAAIDKLNAAGATIGDPAKASQDTLAAIDKAVVATIAEGSAESDYNAR